MFVLVAILVVLVTYFLWLRRDLYKLSWQLSGPFALPIIGNALNTRLNKLHSYLDRLSKTYRGPIRVWFGPILTVFITDADDVEIIMKSKDCLSKPHTFYKMIRDGIGADGLFTSKAEEWKVHRRLVSPTINQASVSMHLPVFNENIRKTIQTLPTNEYFDIFPTISNCKITMFVEAALGTDWEPDVKQRYLQQFVACIEIIAKRQIQPLFHIDFIWNLTDAAKRLRQYSQSNRQLFDKMLEIEVNKGGSGTFMGKLFDISKENPQFTSDDIYAETATILIGATDTSSGASAFVSLMLAMHPEHQEKVFEEIMSILPDKNADLTPTDLDQLVFTDLCIRETLRLFPTAPIVGRIASKPIKLSNNVEVPPGVPFLFGFRQTHIQEKYYGHTANLFNPNRFLDEHIKNLPGAAYIPFSYGPRNCIGIHYAKTSVKCFIAHLIRNYRLTTSYTHIDQLQLVQNISLKLLGKHMIKLERRA